MSEDRPTFAEIDAHTLRLRHLDKLLYPATETTKGEVLHYYAAVAPRILAQMRDRPVTRVRYPHGVGGLNFFEKNAPGGMPSWIPTVEVESVRYPLIDSTASLTYFAHLASLEFHTPQWRVSDGKPRNPDRLVIDLDPGAPAGLDECAHVAMVVKDFFDSLAWPCVPVTSGSKGMQIYAKLDGLRTSGQGRDVARMIAEKLAELDPHLVVAKMAKSLRPGKVFLDWSQNIAAKTTITPWSLRGRNAPFVAAPRSWDEIAEGADSPGTLRQLEMADILVERLNTSDPMDQLSISDDYHK